MSHIFTVKSQMSTTATTNKKLQYPTTWQILYFAETFKHPCDRVCGANESPLVCKYTFDIELHNTLNKVRKLEHLLLTLLFYQIEP